MVDYKLKTKEMFQELKKLHKEIAKLKEEKEILECKIADKIVTKEENSIRFNYEPVNQFEKVLARAEKLATINKKLTNERYYWKNRGNKLTEKVLELEKENKRLLQMSKEKPNNNKEKYKNVWTSM